MGDEIKKTSEDSFADVDFSEDENELRDSEFISIEPKEIKFEENKEEKLSRFYGEGDKLLGEKIIEKKSGAIIEIKYGPLGNKSSVMAYDKNKKLRKSADYYENGSLNLVTEYNLDGSYKSLKYNVDGSRASFVEKHPDGTADAQYFDVDKQGGTLLVKLDANKEVIEKKVVH